MTDVQSTDRPLIDPLQDPRSVKILAKSIHRELERQGWDERAITALATELLGLVTLELETKAMESKALGAR